MPIERIAASVVTNTSQVEPPTPIGNQRNNTAAPEIVPPDESSLNLVDFLDDVFLPTDSFDYPWEMLWENVAGLYNNPI